MPQLNSDLYYNGDCEAAFEHYRSVFGGEFMMVLRFDQMPPDENYPIADDEKNWIMHVSLPVGDNSVLMGSDSPQSMGGVKV